MNWFSCVAQIGLAAQIVQCSNSMFQFKLPAPVFGTFCNGHFDTFLQCVEKRGVGQNYDDKEQPTAVAKDLGKCVFCPNYSFSSKIEKERHIGMFHRRVKTSYKEPTFKCSTCSSTFSSQAILNHHKLKWHNKQEIATASTPKKKHQRKTKQRTINEMLRSDQNNTNDGNSDEEENACSSTNCQINSGNSVVINWVGCESCDFTQCVLG